jgi:regulator of sigma E protease
MLTALAFIFTLGLLVTVHEYGHYQVAKWCGVKILKFSIGFGKPLWSKKIGIDQTEFILAAIPLGGFVKMLDEREFEPEDSLQARYSEVQLKRAFNRQSVTKRIAIVLAGPLANLLLAIFLYWLLFMMGVVGMKPTLGKIVEQSPAASANFVAGDTIKKINGKSVSTWQEVSWTLLNESLKNASVEILTVNGNQQTHIHQLNLSGINLDNANKDTLTVLGLTINQPDIPARIGNVLANSPADLAGLKTNDLVLRINDAKVNVWEDFVEVIRQHANVPVTIWVLRNTERVKLTVRPEPVIENNKTIGRIGAEFRVDQNELDKIFVTIHYSAGTSLIKAAEKTWDIAIFSLKMLGRMVVGEASLKGMSGPVTIASYAGQSANMGVKVFIGFLALISISIGVLNLLPIPVLDGGHLMYYMVEILTGKPVPESVMMVGQKIGLSLIGFMMIIAFYNDINRMITG